MQVCWGAGQGSARKVGQCVLSRAVAAAALRRSPAFPPSRRRLKPVHVAPHQARQKTQKDRVSPQVAAVQVCDGLEGVGATHLQAQAPGGK